MKRKDWEHLGKVFAHLFIAFALTVAFLYQTRNIASSEHCAQPFLAGTIPGIEDELDCSAAWKPRTLALRLAGWYVGIGIQPGAIDYETVYYSIARYNAIWMLLTYFVILAAYRKPLPHMFGTFAAASLAYNPNVGVPGVMPWDMPAMFFFTVFVALVVTRRTQHIVWLAPLATGFKETAMVLPFAILFDNQFSFRKRGAAFVTGILLCFAVKAAMGLWCGGALIHSMTTRHSGNNLTYLLTPILENPLLVNGGTLLVLLLMPIRDRIDMALRAVAVCFLYGIFKYGNMIEYRIFFEMIPVALAALDRANWLSLERAGAEGKTAGDGPASGTHWVCDAEITPIAGGRRSLQE